VVSARVDPREHLLMAAFGVRRRAGIPWRASSVLLSHRARIADPLRHRSEDWRLIGRLLGLQVPRWPNPLIVPADHPEGRRVLVHVGAAQAVRIWPLDRFAWLVRQLEEAGWTVAVAGDENQVPQLKSLQVAQVTPCSSVRELVDRLTGVTAFIGNDSGPGHVAALLGIPTFTIFGPQLPEWFAPAHPRAAWIEGEACPWKPCFDSCRFPRPHCILNLTTDRVWGKLDRFLAGLVEAGGPAGMGDTGNKT